MVQLTGIQIERAAPLFQGWEETMVWSCLQGEMGKVWADEEAHPLCAQLILGDFCFFAGNAKLPGAQELVRHMPKELLAVPRDGEWGALIEKCHWGRCRKYQRYAIKKEREVFDREKLLGLASSLPEGYRLASLDEAAYGWCRTSPWARDFCSQFDSWEDYRDRGLGVVVCHGQEIVGGASSYSVYREGIEIEVDTREDHRRRGLAAACCARLILECLDRGKYPSWDAANLNSVALAEKLGYHLDRPYTTYAVVPKA